MHHLTQVRGQSDQRFDQIQLLHDIGVKDQNVSWRYPPF